jgi:hydrogenase/urease accessory protein HupE
MPRHRSTDARTLTEVRQKPDTTHDRARLRPGPCALVLALMALATTVVRAHDPGLSTLDVILNDRALSATLSMSASDVALAVQASGTNTPEGLRAFARDTIHLTYDNQTLALTHSEVVPVDGGTRIRLSSDLPIRGRSSHARLTIASDVAKRLARGHRELLTVKGDGASTESLLDSGSGPVAVEVAGTARWATRAGSFLTLGVHHILTGYDHLVFLAGLILAACTFRQLLVALTAFTAAHSVSLALVVSAGIRAPASIVEPLIAASIAWVGLENLLRGRPRTRWFVVFGFGLIHGFGFADALIELGFGTSLADIATALVSFNGGVEIGQLGAVAVMLPLVWILQSRPAWQRRLVPACSLLIALAGGYWLIERLS